MGEKRRRVRAMTTGAEAAALVPVGEDKRVYPYTVHCDRDTETKMRAEYDALKTFNASKDPPMITPPIEVCIPQWIDFGLVMAKKMRLPTQVISLDKAKLVVSPYSSAALAAGGLVRP